MIQCHLTPVPAYMCDYDPAQLGHTVPRGVGDGVEVKDPCEELGGEKKDGEEGITTHEQRPKEVPGGIYFLLDRRKRRSTGTEVVNGGSELIQLTFGSSKGIRRYVCLLITYRVTSVSVITDVWMKPLTFREENGRRCRLPGMDSQIAERIQSPGVGCALRAS